MIGADLTIPGIGDAVEVGRGGFGVVYRATEDALGRDVAIKVLAGALDQQATSHFERERRAMATLSGHPNIVEIYRSGVAGNGAPYLVMEYLPGGSLAERFTAGQPAAWEDVVHIGVQLSGALESAHRAGVLHRDVKPDNILLDHAGRPKLGDFGIARLEDRPEVKTDLVTASVSHAPPEVISGQTPDERSDLYSLASTLYEMASGTAAFTRPSDESLIPIFARIVNDPVPDLRRRGVPSELARVLERAMAKQPDDRYATAEDLGAALIDVQRDLGQPTTRMQVSGKLLGQQAQPEMASPPAAAPPAAAPPQVASSPTPADPRPTSPRPADPRASGGRPITKRWVAGAVSVILLAIIIGGVAGYLTSLQ